MTIIRTLAAAIVAAALAAPSAFAQPVDGHANVSKPVARTTGQQLSTRSAQDAPATDARHAALLKERYYGSYSVKPEGPGQDLRSPDAVDAAAGRGTFNAPSVTVVKVAHTPASSGGIDWADVGIGAGGVLGLMLLTLGGGLTIAHRRHAGRQTATIA